MFAVVFAMIDMVNKKYGFDKYTVGNFAFNNLGFSSLNIGNFLFDKTNVRDGNCPDNRPLLLVNGDCMDCNYSGNVDILMGCERCSNNTKLDCLFKVGGNNVVKQDVKNVEIKQIKETPSPNRYKLIKIIGHDDVAHAVVFDNSTNQKKIIAVGDILNGATVKSISAFDGIIVEKNGVIEKLDIGM